MIFLTEEICFVLSLKEFLFSKEKKVGNFHFHPVANKGIFREILIEVLQLMTVTSVDRRNGSEGLKFHNDE